MSLEQLESAILSLAPDERRRLLLWLDENRNVLFGPAVGRDDLTEPQKAELLRRRQEHVDHPERFIRLSTREELDRFFEDIRREVQARVSPARES